jgi:predicted TIM-barrel fold metal-dependent hydrolase
MSQESQQQVIDIHGHVSAPESLYAYKAGLLSHRGAHGRGRVNVSDDQIREAMEKPTGAHGPSHFEQLDTAGISVQVISPRPYTLMHSEQPTKLVDWFVAETNDLIARTCALYPERLRGMGALPQSPWTAPEQWIGEMRRMVNELGFVAVLLNPDPTEGTGTVPPMGDRYWYPVYEALCELGVPALIHSAGCRPPARESYSLHFLLEETIAVESLVNSSVFADFPELNLIVSHGGGAIPYQVGRFLPGALKRGDGRSYLDKLRQLWFDTCLYTGEAIELLLKVAGPSRCLFGSEKPGTGSTINPETGRWFDDIKLLIDDVRWLTDEQRTAVLAGNALSLLPPRNS